MNATLSWSAQRADEWSSSRSPPRGVAGGDSSKLRVDATIIGLVCGCPAREPASGPGPAARRLGRPAAAPRALHPAGRPATAAPAPSAGSHRKPLVSPASRVGVRAPSAGMQVTRRSPPIGRCFKWAPAVPGLRALAVHAASLVAMRACFGLAARAPRVLGVG